MRSRILLALTLVLALVVAPGAAEAAKKKKTRDLRGTIHMAVIGPNGQNGSKFAGEYVGRPLGTAALLFRNTVANNVSTGRGLIYTKKGTIRARTTNQIQPQSDGSVLFPGTFRITGGTGRYKGARGRGTFDGVLPANSTIFELEVEGKIRY